MTMLLNVFDATTRRGLARSGTPRRYPHQKTATLFCILMGVFLFHAVLAGQEPPPATLKSRSAPVAERILPVPDMDASSSIVAGRVLRVALDRPLLRLSKLQAGSELDGQLFRPVYSGERLLLPQGTKVHLLVDHTEKHDLVAEPLVLPHSCEAWRGDFESG